MSTNGHFQRFRHLTDQVKLSRMTILLSHSIRQTISSMVYFKNTHHPPFPSLWSKLSRGRREGQKAGGGRTWDLKSATVPGICHCLVEMQPLLCHDKAASSHRAAQGEEGEVKTTHTEAIQSSKRYSLLHPRH